MPDNIPQHYTTEFSANWIHRVQQSKARLDAFVEEENFNGERKRFDRIGAQNSHRRTERKGPTNIVDPTLDFRWAYRQSFDLGNLLDADDAKNLGALTLPTSDYVKSHANAYNREADDIAWKAALDNAMTGELGATALPLPSTQWIGVGGVQGAATGAAEGLTIEKLLLANQLLEDADLEDGLPRVLCVTAQQLANLLSTTEITSADFNTVRALVNGQIDTFMGFKFIKIKRLRKTANVRTCVGWVKGAIKRIKGAMMSKIDLRADLSYATQIYSSWNLGAARIYDEGVVQIDCLEA
jgi:hypothetical protein